MLVFALPQGLTIHDRAISDGALTEQIASSGGMALARCTTSILQVSTAVHMANIYLVIQFSPESRLVIYHIIKVSPEIIRTLSCFDFE